MIKNIIAALSVVLLLALAYYLFFMGNDMDLEFASTEAVSAQLLQNTQIFVERQRTMQQIDLKTELFQDSRFSELSSFEPAVPVVQVGKRQLFDAIVPLLNQPAPVNNDTPSAADIIAPSS